MRILCASEKKLAPARPCAHCGTPFRPNMKSVWSGKGKCCSPRCRSLLASAKSRSMFTPGQNMERTAVTRAHSLIASRTRRGKIARPGECSKCGNPAELEGHHPDYARPNEVHWLCASCHALAHRNPAFLIGVPLHRSAPVRGRAA